MSEPILKVEGLSKRFHTEAEELVIFENLELQVQSGSRIAVTGESGCGKSTLLNILGGLESPSSGLVTAAGFEITALREEALSRYRASHLGLVFQFHYLLKDFTALENVMLPAFMAGISKKEAQERALRLLTEVGLENRIHHLPSRMSGGERQRAAVARALVNSPDLVLADEPTGNLDPDNSAVVRDILFDMVTKHGKTLILVTHDRAMAAMADRSLHLTREGLFPS